MSLATCACFSQENSPCVTGKVRSPFSMNSGRKKLFQMPTKSARE
jgi:hypothetical protein